MSDSIREPIIFVTPLGSVLQDVCRKLGETPQYEAIELESAADAVKAIDRLGELCLIIFQAGEKDAMTKHLTIMKAIHDRVKAQRVRIIVVAKQLPETWADLYERFGCRDIVKEPVPEKNLRFKISKLSAALAQKRKRELEGEAQAKRISGGSAETGAVFVRSGGAKKSKLDLGRHFSPQTVPGHQNLLIAVNFLISELRYARVRSNAEIADEVVKYLKHWVPEAELELYRQVAPGSLVRWGAAIGEGLPALSPDALRAQGCVLEACVPDEGWLAVRTGDPSAMHPDFVPKLARSLRGLFARDELGR